MFHRIHIWLLSFSLIACSTVQRDPASAWVKNLRCYNDDGSERNCTDRDRVDAMSRNDYVRYHAEAVGVFDSRASSTPSSDIEQEMVYLQAGLRALSGWQSCLYANTGNRAMLLKRVPAYRGAANLYARKIMELGSHHLVSHLFIERVHELSGFGLSPETAEKIEPGAYFWQFTSNPSFGYDYFLNDFRGMKGKLASDKRGGSVATGLRKLCAGLLFCLAGFRADDDLVPEGLDNFWGLSVTGKHGEVVIKGLYKAPVAVNCGDGGIFDSTSSIWSPDCGQQHVKLEAGWKDSY